MIFFEFFLQLFDEELNKMLVSMPIQKGTILMFKTIKTLS
jgi:hypothetical protein